VSFFREQGGCEGPLEKVAKGLGGAAQPALNLFRNLRSPETLYFIGVTATSPTLPARALLFATSIPNTEQPPW
jgi:hypothetical protein